MKHYAGLDVSVKESSICIVDETGKVCREVKVVSHPEDLVQALKDPAWRFDRVGLEAGPLSQWLFSGLSGGRSAGHLYRDPAFPKSQWKSIRTSNAVERLHEEFKRRIKTQTVLPSAQALSPGRPHAALFDRRPGEAAFLQPLRRKDHSRAVKHKDFQTIPAFRTEHENVATIGIALQAFRDQCDKTMHPFSKIDGLRRNEDAYVRAKRYHRIPRSAAMTASSVARSTPVGTRIVASPISKINPARHQVLGDRKLKGTPT